MVPPVALLAIRLGFLALLWLFVVAVVLAVRTDLYGPRSSRRAASPSAGAGAGAPKPGRRQRRQEASRTGRGTPRLVITEGALAGTSLALTGAPVTIGRDDGSTLVITDDFASSHHARVFLQDDEWTVEDLGSTNGTYLDRTKVTHPLRLPPGTPVRIGKTVLELRR